MSEAVENEAEDKDIIIRIPDFIHMMIRVPGGDLVFYTKIPDDLRVWVEREYPLEEVFPWPKRSVN